MTGADVKVHGDVAPGWGDVADAFATNFAESNELGAAVAVYRDGEPVVDLWAGTADAATGAPWERDTVTLVFSTTKGVTAIAVHMLIERGLLDLDAPVATYWPEFAQAGKADLKVRWLLSHQAGLPYVDADLTFEDLLAVEPVIRALEQQRPLWEPGTRHGYHAVTYGHLLGELVRRVTGKTLGEFIADEIVGPLSGSAWLGLPEDQQVKLTRMDRVDLPRMDLGPAFAGLMADFERAITLGHALPFTLVNGAPGDFNDRRLLSVELGGSSLVSDARTLARIYAAIVAEVDGVRLLAEQSVDRARQPQTLDEPYFRWPEDRASQRFMDWALGFTPAPQEGLDSVFGHGGAGGSLAFADVRERLGFAYVMNRMDAGAPDNRAASLVKAVRRCL